jgi:hypothetical protein
LGEQQLQDMVKAIQDFRASKAACQIVRPIGWDKDVTPAVINVLKKEWAGSVHHSFGGK